MLVFVQFKMYGTMCNVPLRISLLVRFNASMNGFSYHERESHHKAIEKIGFICVADRRRRPMKSILTFISASIIVSVDASLREIPHPRIEECISGQQI